MQAEVGAASELSGLDALERTPKPAGSSSLCQAWKAVWPKLGAAGLVIVVWQVVVLVGIWPDYLLPGPVPVLQQLTHDAATSSFWLAVAITLERALGGYVLAVAIGLALGVLVAQTPLLRTAVGSMITGLQSMPSIAWFPLAILLFGLSEGAIVFVVLLGAAPAVANGVISGVDQVSPLLVRSGRAMGATRFQLYRHVVLPAAVPSLLGGLKQAWAFAWRSLMAGELLVIIANRPSLGVRLEQARQFSDAPALLAAMVVIFLIGMLVDSVFAVAGRSVNRRWGLAS
jgi:NitT/TauT family transport system permease protein